MEIITLQEYTDGYISLYQGQIRNLPNDLALRLINKGVAVQHDKDVLSRVTSDDNGKILSVVNGKPAFVENSGGSSSSGASICKFTVNVAYSELGSEATYTLDKTYKEITESDFSICVTNSENENNVTHYIFNITNYGSIDDYYFINIDGPFETFFASTENDYPQYIYNEK